MALFTREPIAAGSFYPSNGAKLREMVDESFPKRPYTVRKGFLNGLIAPHAGYIYSGKTAGKVYYELSKYLPRTFVILGPNHTGMGDDISIMYNASYKTPLGTVNTDTNIGRDLCKSLRLTNDFLAHSKEHSIEVQLPFLQFLYAEKLKILPIVIGDLTLEQLKELGSELAKLYATIIASSDFTHHGDVYGYTPFSNPVLELRDFDMKAVNLIEKLDVNTFHELGAKSTICGYKPITVLMQAMKERGASPHFLDYSTSADITKDYKNVVSYASISFK